MRSEYKTMVLKLVLICFVSQMALFADERGTQSGISTATSLEKDSSYDTDEVHDYLSRKVLIFSTNLDQLFSGGFEEDQNSSLDTESRFAGQIDKQEKYLKIYQAAAWFDDFFKDENYLDIKNKSFVKVQGGYIFDKRGDSALYNKISARIKLPKTQEKLQIFIGDDVQEGGIVSNARHAAMNEGIGIKYYLPLYGRLFSNASLGLSGIDNPYVKTHLEYPILMGRWLFKANQNFKYAVETEFDEWTDLYFDRKLSDKELIRILFQRSTNNRIKGMDYLTQLSYMNMLKNGVGYSYYVAANGRTKDLSDTYENGLHPQEGVYNYSLGAVWRQQLVKEYLFYQIEPILSYHEQYDYRPNYLLRFTIDLYFGYKQ